ncbi:MAG: RHS repeat-associated core domain-containing protein [Thermoanaerobaculia bacterium]
MILNFETGSSHALAKHRTYDLIRPDGTRGVYDGLFPINTYSRATAADLPTTEAQDGVRLVLLAYRGEVVPGESPQLEPSETGARVWTPEGDHWRIWETRTSSYLETAGPSSFRFTLIDHDWNVIQDGEFVVHRCPRFDHSAPGAARSCGLAPVASVNGRIDSLALNPGGPAANDSRGYLGIELTRAPEGLGLYYVKVESLSRDYKVGDFSDFVTTSDVADRPYEGAFQLAFVADHPCPDGRCGQGGCNSCTGSPVYVSSGTYTTSATDLVVPTAGPAIAVARNYLSTPGPDGVVGPGWTSSLESRVYLAPYITGGVRLGTEANVVLPTGLRYKFRLNSLTGHFDPLPGRKDDLVRNADGSFELFLERGSGSAYRFDQHGRLASETDEYGNVVNWERDSQGRVSRIVDLSGTGRWVNVAWTSGGKVDTLTDSAGRTVVYDYDARGRLAGVTDPAGRRTQYDYLRGRASAALLTRISDPWGRVLTDVSYDLFDRTTTYTEQGTTYTYTYADSTHSSKTDDAGRTTSFAFDPTSGVITTRTSADDAFHKEVDSEGRPTHVADAEGVVTEYSYDDEGHVLTVTRNAGQAGAVRYDYAYDPAFPDKVASVTPKNPATNALEPAWQGWRYEYHPTGSTRPGGLKKVYRVTSDGTTADSVSAYEYDAQGRVTRQTTAGGAQTDYGYDNVGNLETVTGAAGTTGRPVTSYQHDALGRVTDVTDPLGKVTHYSYDTLGRVLTVTLPAVGGRTFTTTYSYDHLDAATGFLYTEITDPNGRLTRLGYDVDGRLRRSADASGGATLYGYTGKRLTTITDPNGNVTTYGYDAGGRLASTSFPDGGQETYTYWNDGLLRTKTDRRGTVVTYAYDAFKRLVTKSYSTGGSVTYAYDGQKLLTVTDTTVTPAETHSFGYDTRYRLSSAAQAGRGTLGYTYTADDRVETLTLPSGPTATYGYNPDGSLHTLQWSAVAGAFTWDYTARGQYDTLTFPNGQLRDYGYDDQGRLTSLTNALGASTLASYAYGYDVDPQTGQPTLLGQRTSQTATLPSQGLASAVTRYGYDPLYQLTRAEYPAGAPFNSEVHTWSYDSIGNRMTQGSGASVQAYTYLKSPGNPLNGQRLEGDGVDAMTYDPAGNLGTRQGPAGNFTFGYDPENRLKTITGPENSTYTYDYQGRRTSKTVGGVTTTYLYDGLNLVSETTGGQTTYFLNGPGIDEPLAMSRAGAVSYFSVDGLGSVVATNDPSGTVTHSVVFDAWGNVRAETGTRTHPFTYTGREVGEAAFHFYRARFYQPSIGRFIQEDPLGFLSGPNRFGYVRGNPTRAGDPLGLFDWVRDVLEPVSNFSAGFGDTISLGLTYRIRDLTGANSVVDPCDFWYSAGDKAGIAHSLALGGASAARGALAMGGRSGTVLARLARGGGRFFSDPRTYGTVGKQYWKARGGAGVMSLHHWLLPQRAGALNAGWNLLEVPGAFNSWMGYSSVGRGVEWGLRFAIPGSLLGAAIEGAFWGISKDEWQKNCGCGQ